MNESGARLHLVNELSAKASTKMMRMGSRN